MGKTFRGEDRRALGRADREFRNQQRATRPLRPVNAERDSDDNQ